MQKSANTILHYYITYICIECIYTYTVYVCIYIVYFHIFAICSICIYCCLVAKSCLTLCDPMDCSLPGSSVHGIFQARILEWEVIPFSRGALPGIKPIPPALEMDSLPLSYQGNPYIYRVLILIDSISV